MSFQLARARRIFVRLALVCLLPAVSCVAGLVETNSWSLTSPDGKCEICVSLDANSLSYFALYNGKVVIQKSPLGLQRDDQDLQRNLTFGHAGEGYSHREQYELFTGIQ